jgi:hypothetical protein
MQSVSRRSALLVTRYSLLSLSFAASLFLFGQPVLAAATGDGCGGKAQVSAVTELQQITSSDSSQWSCQKVTPDIAQFSCIDSPQCSGDGVKCCIPGVGAPPGQATTTTPQAKPVKSGLIQLPGCISTGDCSLDEIVQTGAAFANFLFGLSGAVALGILVYAGVLYLTAAGESKKVGKAKEMLMGAAIGLVIVFGANAIIRFVVQSLTQPEGVSACDQLNAKRKEDAAKANKEPPSQLFCTAVPGANQKEIEANAANLGCEPKTLCAPDQGQNARCCPIEPPVPEIK